MIAAVASAAKPNAQGETNSKTAQIRRDQA
jgi:hypothetical protein